MRDDQVRICAYCEQPIVHDLIRGWLVHLGDFRPSNGIGRMSRYSSRCRARAGQRLRPHQPLDLRDRVTVEAWLDA
jgi:hypothetical protein